jgi:hypothetical protein
MSYEKFRERVTNEKEAADQRLVTTKRSVKLFVALRRVTNSFTENLAQRPTKRKREQSGNKADKPLSDADRAVGRYSEAIHSCQAKSKDHI